MADVQLEHGHVRVANRLYEALLYAEFSGVQFKILHAIVRLTYGWRHKTVTLSHTLLAEAIHLRVSGNFRRALAELITEGVVIQATTASGGKHATYALEKNHVRWGRFSVSSERLERIYGERPACDDDALVQGDLIRDTSPTQTPARDTRPKRSPASDRNGPERVTETVIGTASKSFDSTTYNVLQTVTDSDRQHSAAQSSAEPFAVRTPLAHTLGVDHMPVVDRFLDLLDPSTHDSWYRILLQTVGPSTGALPEDLAGALEDAIAQRAFKPVAVRAFAVRRRQERQAADRASAAPAAVGAPTLPTPQRVHDDAAWHAALAIAKDGAQHTLTAERYAALPWPARYALKMLGGWRVIGEADERARPFVRRDYLASYNAAPAEQEAVAV